MKEGAAMHRDLARRREKEGNVASETVLAKEQAWRHLEPCAGAGRSWESRRGGAW